MTAPEIKAILDAHKKWLGGVGGRRADLRGADLREADLSDADLSRADLRGAIMIRADLREADLSDADLSRADLRGAIMIRAIMSRANLREANLREANLREAIMNEADLRGANLRWTTGYIMGPQRRDGYRFDLRWTDGAWRVVAGCNTRKNWTTDKYREHAAGYDDGAKQAETLAILAYLDAAVQWVPTGDSP